MNKPFEIIGAGFGWGASLHETEWGPQALKDFGILSVLQLHDPRITWRCLLTPSNPYTLGKKLSYEERVQQVALFSHKLSQEVILSQKNHRPLILGGDHAIAIGTWSAMAASLQLPGEFGLIWIDAHMDSHTIHTTPSKAVHGMPLAVLMGYGEEELVNLCFKGPKLNPRHVVIIGVRSFEAGEAKLLEHLNVKIYSMEAVKKKGPMVVLKEAVQYVNQGTQAFGLSIDLDAFDPSIAPGVGTPEADGLFYDEHLASALSLLGQHPKFCALEIAEYNPTRDKAQKTARLVQQLALAIGKKDG